MGEIPTKIYCLLKIKWQPTTKAWGKMENGKKKKKKNSLNKIIFPVLLASVMLYLK